jgi:hypothetical protein
MHVQWIRAGLGSMVRVEGWHLRTRTLEHSKHHRKPRYLPSYNCTFHLHFTSTHLNKIWLLQLKCISRYKIWYWSECLSSGMWLHAALSWHHIPKTTVYTYKILPYKFRADRVHQGTEKYVLRHKNIFTSLYTILKIVQTGNYHDVHKVHTSRTLVKALT